MSSTWITEYPSQRQLILNSGIKWQSKHPSWLPDSTPAFWCIAWFYAGAVFPAVFLGSVWVGKILLL